MWEFLIIFVMFIIIMCMNFMIVVGINVMRSVGFEDLFWKREYLKSGMRMLSISMMLNLLSFLFLSINGGVE